MKNYLTFVLVLLVFIFLSSCKKNEALIERKDTFPYETKPLSYSVVKNISATIKKMKTFQTTSIENSKFNDSQIKNIVKPLIENGKEIHNEIIDDLKSSPEWSSLSIAERELLINFNDIQLAELSLVFVELQNNITLREDDNWTTVRSCLSGAFGLGDLYYLLIENPRALATARGSLSLLKHIGGRYLGYIGLGLAIIDFADCISR